MKLFAIIAKFLPFLKRQEPSIGVKEEIQIPIIETKEVNDKNEELEEVILRTKTFQNAQIGLLSGNPDTMLFWFCMLAGCPSIGPKINIFLHDTVSPNSSLTRYSKSLLNSIINRAGSLDIPFFNFTVREDEADIIIKISTRHRKVDRVRRRIIFIRWTSTDIAEKTFKAGAKKASKKNIKLYKLNVIEAEGLKEFGTNSDEVANNILMANGFLKECAYLISYKSILAAA